MGKTITLLLPVEGGDTNTWGEKILADLQTIIDGFATLAAADVGLGNVPNLDLSDRSAAGYGATTQPSTTISDFAEAARDVIGATIVAGSGIGVTVDDTANTITIAASTVLSPVRLYYDTVGGVWPARSTVTTNPLQPVDWVGPAGTPPPVTGIGAALPNDFWYYG